jgi:glyoxylase-like metal-dependent hydrolase (beta-lactamase superfamily II)
LGAILSFAAAGAEPESAMIKVNRSGIVPLKLYVFECGRILTRDVSVFNPPSPKGTAMNMVSPCYMVEHPQGRLFWDAGIRDSLITEKNGLENLNGLFKLSVHKTLRSQLKEIGVDPKEVDFLALSHLHIDHAGNANYFAAATWLVQKSSHQLAFGNFAEKYGFVQADYRKLERAKTVNLHGDYDVFGDGSVVILHTPGHTPGHQSLWIDLPNSGPVLLSGDLYLFRKNREDYGISAWNDKKMTVRSFARIDEILDRTGADLWIHHDKEQFDSQRKSPDYYD